MAQKDIRGYVLPRAEELAQRLGYTLVDAELVKEGPGRYLRIYLDKEGGFTLDDCEAFHRAIQPMVETVDYDFLEVSSPGADRPLKTAEDFGRAMDSEVEAKLYKAVDGRKAVSGRLKAVDAETITIETAAGDVSLARRQVAQVKPVIHFDEDDTDGGEG